MALWCRSWGDGDGRCNATLCIITYSTHISSVSTLLKVICHINAMSSYQKPRKGFLRMDPDCAVCRAPAAVQCACERKGLDNAVRQAEERMMTSIYNDIR